MKFISLSLFIAMFLIVSPSFSAKSSKKAKQSKKVAQNQNKIKKGSMAESKKELLMIISSFRDQEGGKITKIEKLSKDRYKVDVKSKKGKCISHKVKTSGAKPVYDLKVYKCD